MSYRPYILSGSGSGGGNYAHTGRSYPVSIGTLIDTYEDQGLTEYDRADPNWSVVAAAAYTGNYGLRADGPAAGTGGLLISLPASLGGALPQLPIYPRIGDTISVVWRCHAGSRWNLRLAQADISFDNHINISHDLSTNSLDLSTDDNGIGNVLGTATPATPLQYNAWYQTTIQWQPTGRIEVIVRRIGSAEKTTLSGTVTFTTGGGWCYYARPDVVLDIDNATINTRGTGLAAIDTFESGEFTRYTAVGALWSVSQDAALVPRSQYGARGTEQQTGDDTNTVHSVDEPGFGFYPHRGDTIEYRFRYDSLHNYELFFGVQPGTAAPVNRYEIQHQGGNNRVVLAKLENDGASRTVLARASITLDPGTTYRERLQWVNDAGDPDGTIKIHLSPDEANGDPTAAFSSTATTTLSAIDDTYYEGGVGHLIGSNGSVAVDDIVLVDRVPYTPVAAPTNLVVTDYGRESMSLDWAGAADSFDVLRAEAAGTTASDYSVIATVTTTDYVDTGLEHGERYYYRVANAGDPSSISSEVHETTFLAPPSQVAVDTSTGSQLTVTWQNNDNSPDGNIQAYRSTASGSLGTLVGQTTAGTSGATTATAFTDTNVNVGERYHYTIRRETDHRATDSPQASGVVAAPVSVMDSFETGDMRRWSDTSKVGWSVGTAYATDGRYALSFGRDGGGDDNTLERPIDGYPSAGDTIRFDITFRQTDEAYEFRFGVQPNGNHNYVAFDGARNELRIGVRRDTNYIHHTRVYSLLNLATRICIINWHNYYFDVYFDGRTLDSRTNAGTYEYTSGKVQVRHQAGNPTRAYIDYLRYE